ncbi:MAG TPA: DUF998 domain-containing protein [Thermoplasmata archaeon]|nr:DUF998 domain-containing protein [Thermoplasmata archaeon]
MAGAEPRLGPLVHRAVHHGALLWIVGAVQFVVAMAVVEWRWTTAYSLRTNYISDLGNTQCGDWPHAASSYVCSPWHSVFNGSIIVLGLLVILGALLLRSAFPSRSSRSVGLLLLILAGLGSIGVGLSPENVNIQIHTVSALLSFAGGNLALIVLGFVMFRDTRWDGYRAYSMFSGLVGLIALALFSTHVYLGLGVGGMERLIVAPLLLWLVVASIHLLRIPTFAPRIIPKSPGV